MIAQNDCLCQFPIWCSILELVRTAFAACLPAKALAANSFIKIHYQNFEKEKSGRTNHTAFDTSRGHERLEQLKLAIEELCGDVFCDHTLVFLFGHSLQCLVAPFTRIDVHAGHPLAVAALDADEPLAPETRICDVEVETPLVGNLDGLNRSGEDVVVRTMFTSKPVGPANDLAWCKRKTSFSQLV